MTWRDAHIAAGMRAQRLHRELGSPRDRPVDVFGAIQQLGIFLAFSPLQSKVAGVYLREPAPAILINQLHPRTRQRYSAGHELGHHVFKHRPPPDGDLEGQILRGEDRRWPREEMEAEAFGAWFLMPRKNVLAGLERMGRKLPESHRDVYSLAVWLGTSYVATARHLATLDLVPRATANAWAKIAPATIKQELAGDLVPEDLRNDVWWLDQRHHGATLEARVGDRFVLTLEEVPSSGITWQLESLPGGSTVLGDSFHEGFGGQLALTAGDAEHDEELAGQAVYRTWVVGIDEETHGEVAKLRMSARAPWEDEEPEQVYELGVTLAEPQHGLRVSEESLALPS